MMTMPSGRVWRRITAWTLPVLILAAGLLPPDVHPVLVAPLALCTLLLAIGVLGGGGLASPRVGVAAPLLAFALIVALSMLTSLQLLRSLRQIVLWSICGIVLVSARSLCDLKDARRVASVIALLGAVLASLGLYQSVVAFPAAEASLATESSPGESAAAGLLDAERPPSTGPAKQSVPEAVAARLRSGRAIGSFALPALLGSVLILGAPLAAAEAAAAHGAWRVLWAGAALVQLAALVATKSVGAAGGLAAALPPRLARRLVSPWLPLVQRSPHWRQALIAARAL